MTIGSKVILAEHIADHEDRVEALIAWAAYHEAQYHVGQVGFMRPCVGIVKGNHYISYGGYIDIHNVLDDGPLTQALHRGREGCFPSPEDSYHKDDSFCVLLKDQGDVSPLLIDEPKDYPIECLEPAVRQLYEWALVVQKNDLVIVETSNKPSNALEALFAGFSTPHWVKREDEGLFKNA